MKRDYQRNFSANMPSMFEEEGRVRKAVTTTVILKKELSVAATDANILVVGASSGIIDHYLSSHFKSVIGVDIDEQAIRYARREFQRPNLAFLIGDAMALPFDSHRFDAVVCAQVYEHVPDASQLLSEIYRVMKPDGICYFAAGNRLNLMEPHYHLPFLSVIPRPLAHIYMRLAKRGNHYYEKHLSYWGLRRLVRKFKITDYSVRTIERPEEYAVEYMLPRGTLKHRIALILCRHFIWLLPGYIWILRKPA